jgi:hypothetical protein
VSGLRRVVSTRGRSLRDFWLRALGAQSQDLPRGEAMIGRGLSMLDLAATYRNFAPKSPRTRNRRRRPVPAATNDGEKPADAQQAKPPDEEGGC